MKMKLNSPRQLPPVHCPLVIQLPDGRLEKVERKEYVGSHADLLTYHRKDGVLFVGRFPWTYP